MQTVASLRAKMGGQQLPQTDPDVVIPPAVKRAAEAAEAAQAAQAAQAAMQPVQLEHPAPQPQLPQQVPPPAPETDPNAPPVPHNASPSEDWQVWRNRYEAILGRFREANGQLVQQNNRIEALETMLANVRNAPAAAASPAQPERPSLITKEDEENMGPEMIDFVRRAAREVAAPYEAEIAALKAQLAGQKQDQQLTAKQKMHADLDGAMPNWNEINHDPEFHAWLLLQDAYSGATRKSLLTQAYAQNNTARVLAIFKGFVSERATLGPAGQETDTTPAPAQPDRPSLESLAAPGRARTTASPAAPAEKQLIRTSDINAFYRDVRRGAYRGRENLQMQYEAELAAAMREGRVVQDT